MAVILVSCSPGTDTTTIVRQSRDVLPSEDIESLRQITDHVLVALSTRQNGRLRQWIEPGKTSLKMDEIARGLLGPYARTLVIDHWDARQIAITSNPEGNQAESRVQITYRRSPNRTPQQVVFQLRFYRSLAQHRWFLVVS